MIKKIAFIFSLIFIINTNAQPPYKLHISNIRISEPTETNWYGRPVASDFVVHWELFNVENEQEPVRVSVSGIPAYRVHMSRDDSTFAAENTVTDTLVSNAGKVVFAGYDVGPKYYFRIDGLDQNNNVIVRSDTAWAINGKPGYLAQFDADTDEDKKSIPIPLFFPLSTILDLVFDMQNDIYNQATPYGKIAFTFIWYFFLFGVVYILPFRCMKNIQLGLLFPLNRSNLFNVRLNKDRNFEERISARFLFVIEAWKKVMAKTNNIVSVTNAKSLDEVNQKCYRHFKSHGSAAINVLKDLVNYDPEKNDNWHDLEKRVKEHFGETGVFGDIISKSIKVETEYRPIKLEWNELKGQFFSAKSRPLRSFPTGRILAAGLENHLINGFQWQKVSEEVDRAIENRAATELSSLHEKSFLEWLWNLGALSPLLGLFGTVTGITNVFSEIRGLEDTSHLQLVQQLSGGIFEALWTTVFGLIFGIILMMIFYYYKNIIDWIYGKWESIFVPVTENL